MQTIDSFCKKMDLNHLNSSEKTALYYAFNEQFNKLKAGDILNENFPHIKLQSGYSSAAGQDQNSLILLFILKRSLLSISNQKTLIEQNEKIIELLTKISDKE